MITCYVGHKIMATGMVCTVQPSNSVVWNTNKKEYATATRIGATLDRTFSHDAFSLTKKEQRDQRKGYQSECW